MSRDASGTYTAPSNSFNPAVEGATIDEGDWNTTLDDIEAALTDSLSISGKGKITAHIDFDETTVSSPSSNVGRLYSKDVGGVTSLFFKDSAGTDTNLLLSSPGIAYTFSTSTTMGDPGSGFLRFNNATLASVTAVAIDDNDANGADLSTYVLTWDDTGTTDRGTLLVQNRTSPGNVVIFTVSGASTDNAGWTQLAVTYVTHYGSFPSNAPLGVTYLKPGVGVAGPTGANGIDAGIRWLFASSTSMADPSAGNVRLNNATLSSVTAAAISASSGETGNPSVLAFLQALDDSTTTGHRGYLIIKKATAPQNFAIFDITGALTDNTTWVQTALTHVASSGSFSASDVLSVQFSRTGDKGADGAGSFSSLSPGAGTTSDTTANAPGSAITTSGTISAAELINAQTGTTYTVLDGDRAKLLTFSNAASIAVTLPQAGLTTTFKTGWFVDVVNLGAGTATITPTTSTINGAATLALLTGQGCRIASDGTNYQISNKPIPVSIAGTLGTTMTFPSSSSTVLTTGNTATITKGYTLTPNLIGTVTSGTTTLDPTAQNYQMLINGGSFFLSPPAAGTYDSMDLLVINGPSAGSIIFTAGKWRVGSVTGSTFTSTSRSSATVTMTIASPCVVSWTSHGCVDGDPFYLTTTGALPTGLSINTVYYVKYIDANSFNLATTPGGASINTTGSQSGTHTGTACSQFILSVREIYGSATYAWYALQ